MYNNKLDLSLSNFSLIVDKESSFIDEKSIGYLSTSLNNSKINNLVQQQDNYKSQN